MIEDSDKLNIIKEIIKTETGIIINEERIIDLDIVVKSRIKIHELILDNYIELLKNNYSELILLASYFTIQETSFYRYKSHYDRLKTEIIPEIIKKNADFKTINILSAGCATGEEPYTISMIINEYLQLNNNNKWTIKIIATDINKNALDIAQNGIYTEYKLRNLDASYKNKYFNIIMNGKNKSYQIIDSVRQYVIFKHYNLIKDPFELAAENTLDIIFCENVIIYFCLESIQRLINNFYRVLKNPGYLFLGFSETLNFFNHNFSLSWWNDSFIYMKDQKADSATIFSHKDTLNELDLINIRPDEYIDISEHSYTEFLKLMIKFYKEEQFDNVKFLIQSLENSKIKLDEVFYIIKAELLCDTIDFLNAANECRKAISINPYFIDAHIILGMIYLELNMYESAEFEIKTALYIDNSSILANYYYAMYQKMKENDDAFALYNTKAVALLNDNGGIFKNTIYPVNEKTRKNIRQDLSNKELINN